MSFGGRSPLRLGSRVVVAGAGSTFALIAAIAAVATLGAGLVAFDAWPTPKRALPAAPLPLAPGAPAGATLRAATDVAAQAGGSPAATGGVRDSAPDTATAPARRPSGVRPTPVRSVPREEDPAAGAPTTATPVASDLTSTGPPPETDDGGGSTAAALADITRDVAGGLGPVTQSLPAGADQVVLQAVEVVAQALERLPG